MYVLVFLYMSVCVFFVGLQCCSGVVDSCVNDEFSGPRIFCDKTSIAEEESSVNANHYPARNAEWAT